jgi:hypothetical protein
MTDNRRLMTAEERRRYLEHARDLFNRGDYWLAHEALETVWRSIIKQDEARAGRVYSAAAAPVASCAGESDTASAGAAVPRNWSAWSPEVEFETVEFRAQLARALAGEGDAPRLEFRSHD